MRSRSPSPWRASRAPGWLRGAVAGRTEPPARRSPSSCPLVPQLADYLVLDLTPHLADHLVLKWTPYRVLDPTDHLCAAKPGAALGEGANRGECRPARRCHPNRGWRTRSSGCPPRASGCRVPACARSRAGHGDPPPAARQCLAALPCSLCPQPVAVRPSSRKASAQQ
jgi:hypothetical protein